MTWANRRQAGRLRFPLCTGIQFKANGLSVELPVDEGPYVHAYLESFMVCAIRSRRYRDPHTHALTLNGEAQQNGHN